MAVQRRLAAILAADVAGYSRLMGEDEEGTLATLTAHLKELIEPCIAEHRGRVVKTMGDGVLAEFASVVDAVRCAVAFQEGMAERNADIPEDRRIEFRIGINLGDVIVQDNDVFGDGVNVAARLEGLAVTGGVVVSDKVHAEVRTKLDVGFDDLGPQEVKNIAEPVRAYRVRVKDGPASAPGQVSGVSLPLPDKPSIAVLPFTNMSGDPEQEYFAEGIAEDLITALSRFHWFFVIARNSSFSFKGASPDVRDVARDLGVQYVLEGSVRKAGSRVRITAQLIEAHSGRHVWADRYDRELDDIFALQDEITESIAAAVAPSFVSAEARRVERKPPEGFDAWDYAMRAKWHLWRINREDVAAARRLFHQAIERDPKSAVAYSGLATAYNMEMYYGWAESREDAASEAKKAAETAVALDDRDAEAHYTLGFVRFWSRQFDDAVKSVQRAIELNPNSAAAEGILGLIYGGMDDYEKTMQHVANAERLSPHDPDLSWWHLGRATAEFQVERYDEAVRWAKSVIELAPGLPSGWRMLAASCAHLDRLEEARSAIEQLLQLAPLTSIETSRATVPANEAWLESYLDGLRKAGLPE